MSALLDVDARLRQGAFILDARFIVPRDSITAIFGPSGAGKTTLLAAIAGLKKLDAGRIALAGRVFSGAGVHVAPHRRGIGLCFQDARLFPHLTCRQNIAYAIRRAPKAIALDELAGFFEIEHLLDRPVTNLSGGEKSRLALARALASAPNFLLLDEPFAALDGARKRSFIEILLAMHKTYRLPMLVVSHNIDDVAALASHVVALKDGAVAIAGPLAEASRAAPFQALLDSRDTGAVLAAATLWGGETSGSQGLWLRADHVLLASRHPVGISARNILEGRVVAVSPDRQRGLLVELETPAGILLSRVTPEAAEELELAPGRRAWALVKAHALS